MSTRPASTCLALAFPSCPSAGTPTSSQYPAATPDRRQAGPTRPDRRPEQRHLCPARGGFGAASPASISTFRGLRAPGRAHDHCRRSTDRRRSLFLLRRSAHSSTGVSASTPGSPHTVRRTPDQDRRTPSQANSKRPGQRPAAAVAAGHRPGPLLGDEEGLTFLARKHRPKGPDRRSRSGPFGVIGWAPPGGCSGASASRWRPGGRRSGSLPRSRSGSATGSR